MGSAKKPKKRAHAGVTRHSQADRIAKFIEAMLQNGGNQTAAAESAGYTPGRAAEQAGWRLMKNKQVVTALEARRAGELERAQAATGVSIERTLRELGRICYFDPRKLFDDKGNLKPVHELDDETAAAIAQVEQFEEFQGRGEDRELVGYTKKVKIFDKNPAIDKAMKHLGLFEADNKQKPATTVQVGVLTVPAEALNFEKVRARALKHPV